MRDFIDSDCDGHVDGQPEHPYGASQDYPDPESYMPLPPRHRCRRCWTTDNMAEADPYAGNPVPLE